MFARNLLILALFSPKAVLTAVAPIVAMTVLALIFVRRERAGRENRADETHLESPVSLKRVLTFAGLFLLIQIISTLGDKAPNLKVNYNAVGSGQGKKDFAARVADDDRMFAFGIG